jgi:hypothetical protein
MVTTKSIGLRSVLSRLNSHASFLQGTPYDFSNDEGPLGGGEPNVPIDAPNRNNDEVKLGIQIGKAFCDAWGACDVTRNESMRQTNNENVD